MQRQREQQNIEKLKLSHSAQQKTTFPPKNKNLEHVFPTAESSKYLLSTTKCSLVCRLFEGPSSPAI